MSKSTRIAIVQTNWPGNREQMKKQYRELAAQAASAKAEVLCLQELSISPYFCSKPPPSCKASTGCSDSGSGGRGKAGEDCEWAELIDGESNTFFKELATTHKLWVVGSFCEKDPSQPGLIFNTATVHNPQGVRTGFTRKVHIPSGPCYEEDLYFTSGDEVKIHDVAGIKLGVPTCYDEWFPELARLYALKGADFIFYPTAIGHEPTALTVDSRDAWQTVMRGHAVANGVYIGAANRIGVEDVRFYGSSFLAGPDGTVVAQASRHSQEVLITEISHERLAQWRALFPLVKQRRPEVYGGLVELPSKKAKKAH